MLGDGYAYAWVALGVSWPPSPLWNHPKGASAFHHHVPGQGPEPSPALSLAPPQPSAASEKSQYLSTAVVSFGVSGSGRFPSLHNWEEKEVFKKEVTGASSVVPQTGCCSSWCSESTGTYRSSPLFPLQPASPFSAWALSLQVQPKFSLLGSLGCWNLSQPVCLLLFLTTFWLIHATFYTKKRGENEKRGEKTPKCSDQVHLEWLIITMTCLFVLVVKVKCIEEENRKSTAPP